jgi:hypothetical protein
MKIQCGFNAKTQRGGAATKGFEQDLNRKRRKKQTAEKILSKMRNFRILHCKGAKAQRVFSGLASWRLGDSCPVSAYGVDR